MNPFFDRVVVINLKRRADRKERLLKHLEQIKWPFVAPTWFDAIDASLVPVPAGWMAGGGAWGCMQSHRQVLQSAIMDGVNRLLVLEDDVYFVDAFAELAQKFVAEVPADWEQLMFGGQYVNRDGALSRVSYSDDIEIVSGCERTHAYAVQGAFLRDLYAKWCGSCGHCDHVMGPFQKGRRVYAPKEFFAGQYEGKSDISHQINPSKLWVKPPDAWKVTLFIGKAEEAKAFREKHQKHSGHNLRDEVDIGLTALMESPEEGRIDRLRAWVSMIEWEGRSKTPEKQCMIYGVPEKLCRDALKERLVVVGKKAGCCGTVANALRAAGRVASAVVAGDGLKVEPDVKRARHEVCLKCEHLTSLNKHTPFQCGLCNCFIGLKTALATESCPDGKWDAATVKGSLTAAEDVPESAFGKLVSFSLWGDQTKYTLGILENAKLMPDIYPEWTMRVYIERGHYLIARLRALSVDVVEMDREEGSRGMFWRFLAADDTRFSHVVFRDADSRINARESAAVEQWIKSGTALHVMRDHYWHLQKPVIGGAWGIKTNSMQMRDEIAQWSHSGRYGDDELFLANVVWPLFYPRSFIRHSVEIGSADDTPFPEHRHSPWHVCEQVAPNFSDWRGRIVLINPDRFKNRLSRFTESIRLHGGFMSDLWQRFPATPIENIVPPPGFEHFDTYPHYCAVSLDHRRIIDDAIADGVENLIVFEDDAKFSPDAMEYFSRMWLSLPDGWLGGMLGGQHYTDGNRRYTEYPEALARIDGCLGMHAVFYSKDGLIAARDFFAQRPTRTIDQAFTMLQRLSDRWYAPAKWIVEIDPEATQFAAGDSPCGQSLPA